jgi:hypothetical protein
MTKTTETLAQVLERAEQAIPNTGRMNGANDWIEDGTRKQFAGTHITLDAGDALPDLLDAEGRVTRTPSAQPAGETVTLSTAAAANSRVVRAGAVLIPIVGDIAADTGAGVPALLEVPERFTVIKPAEFQNLIAHTTTGEEDDAEAEVTASNLPFASVDLSRDDIRQHAVRFEIPRSTLRTYGRDVIAAHALSGIALGIGRAVDNQLLTALGDAVSGEFSVAAAALAGLRYEELAAIIGTSGNGVSLPIEAGKLNVHGVPADTSADCADTFVGAFDRAGVWIDPEIDLLVERRRDGGLNVTCWLGLQAALPDPSYFWKAGSV